MPKLAPAISVPTKPEDSDLAVTDCKSLYDLVARTSPPSCSEFRVQLVARAIKESLREGTIARWVHGGAQLADSLTKSMESNFLRETLRLGSDRLCAETATLKERAKTKDQLRWLRMQHDGTEASKESLKSLFYECEIHKWCACNPAGFTLTPVKSTMCDAIKAFRLRRATGL